MIADSVITIRALGDNFICLCPYSQDDTFVVDPCDSSAVLRVVTERGLNLTTILATHHHWDHVGGISELKKATGCRVIGGDKRRIPAIDRCVGDGDIITAGRAEIRVIATPGHTRTSVCYYVSPSADEEHGVVFTGDAMFVGGCGRLLECEAETMLGSLLKLARLPDGTRVYCGHDYALENYQFALRIEPSNMAVQQRLEQLRKQTAQGHPTVPSTILDEKTTNPFLRTHSPELKRALNMPDADTVAVFAELRRRKNLF